MVRNLSIIVLAFVSFLACNKPSQSPLVSSSNQYRLCELDTHCPAAMYCSAGVCDFDCSSDSDCGAGLSCDPRGRCLAPGVTATPPKFAGQLTASATTLALTPEQNQGSFTLQNTGQAAIGRFHVLSDDPGISATPASGSIPAGGSVTVSVTVDTSFSGVVGTLHVLSTGGRSDLAIEWGSDLAGRLEGSVTVTSPFQLGTAPIALELGGDPAALTGSVDGTASLLWPVNAAMTASDDGTHFAASFVIVAPAGSSANPLFDVPVQRTVQLEGTHSSPSSVSGEYTESIAYGAAGVGPFKVVGSFELRNVGGTTGVAAQPMGSFAQRRAPAIPAACACTDPSCPSGAQAQADWFFDGGFGFEQLTDACNAQSTCMLADGTVAACALPPDVQCALSGYAALGSTYGQTGMVDVWRAQATYAQLQGKSQIANVLQPYGTAPGGTTVQEDIAALTPAIAALNGGLHGPAALLSAASLARAAPTDFGGTSTRDATRAQPPLSDVGRFTGVVSSTLYGGSELVDRMQRSEDEAYEATSDGGVDGGFQAVPAEMTAQQLTTGALLDLAALGTLLPPQGDTDPVPGLMQSFNLIAQSFRNAVHGLNAVGYADNYVPFLYSASNPSATDVFMQIYDFLGGDTGTPFSTVANVAGDEAAFESSATSCAEQAQQLDQVVLGAQSSAADAITKLCGSAPVNGALPSDCATNTAGQIEQDFESAQAVQQAVQEAQQRHSAAAGKIMLLNQQLQEETNDYTDDITLTEAQGAAAVQQAQAGAIAAQAAANQAQAVNELNNAKQNENTASLVDNCVNSVFSSLSGQFATVLTMGMTGIPSAGSGGGLPGAGCVPLVSQFVYGEPGDQQSADSDALATAQAQATAAEDGVTTAEDAENTQLQVLFGQQQIQDNAMFDQVVDAINDEDAAVFEIQQQTDLFDAATDKVRNDLAQVQQAMATWTQDQELAEQSPVGDPTFRLYEDANGLKLSFDMRVARTWCFLAARAFEYTVNMSSTYPEQCLEAVGSQDLASALAGMYSDYGTDLIEYGTPDERSDLLSLRAILGITGPVPDNVTGQPLSEAQQFQALLALPTNRDANGNVQLKFATSILSGNPTFSTQVAMDTIRDLKMSLDGSQLAGQTAYVTLIHSGSGQLRGVDGSLTQYQLESKTALVPAAINDSELATDSSVPVSTDLFGRPVDDPSWTLIIDQTDDPLNAAIDVTELQDISILVDHQGVALQQSP